MSAIYKDGQWYGKGGGDTSSVELTQLEYDALTEEEKNNGTVYYITDAQIVSNFTVLGNRFDKANIYTADERMIGSYLGKPLYQKTWTELDVTPQYNVWTDIITAPVDIENIVAIETKSGTGIMSGSGLEFGIINGKIASEYNVNVNRRAINTMTMQYTKTSDGTVNVGTGNDYSTDEQIIGTWINGKRLYQKVFNITTPSSGEAASVLDTALLSMDTCIECKCFITDFGSGYKGNKPLSWMYSSDRYACVWCNITDHSVFVRAISSVEQNKSAILILQYTKTTD